MDKKKPSFKWQEINIENPSMKFVQDNEIDVEF